MERLFVYGTLAPGGPNEHVLSPLGGTWTPAVVRGDLVDRGWGGTCSTRSKAPATNAS